MQNLFSNLKSWPFEQARKILTRIGNKLPSKGYVLFETGYGPSGLPHMGTFGEVVRTKFVQHAFEYITGMETRLFVVSDDYDGLRKVPDNVPNKEMLKENIDVPLTSVPDPFGTHQSFGHNMNSRLRSFLDSFGFEYEFKSATDLYKTGALDEYLMKALAKYQEIMDVMIPTLGDERQKTYSPFLPICKHTAKVLYVPLNSVNAKDGTISYTDPRTGNEVTTSVKGGACKLQWKPDFGVRWAALDVDFEMYGKDHLANGPIYSKICKIVGGKSPEQFVFELFLDKEGKKISKSKGNEEITVNGWLKYAPTESLALYMFQSPQRAKRLYFDVIPKAVDEYVSFVKSYHNETDELKKLDNPAWHIHKGNVPQAETFGISYSLLLNLASACNPEDKTVLWAFITKYVPAATAETSPFLDKLADCAVHYYNDFIKNSRVYKNPSEDDLTLLEELKKILLALQEAGQTTSDEIQAKLYEFTRNHNVEQRDFFLNLYKLLLGQEQGPRLGTFFALLGINNSIKLFDQAMQRG